MDADKNVTANFAKKQIFTLSATAVNGSVVLNPAGGNYEEGTQVSLTAVPNTSYVFNGWKGDLEGAENPITITMDADKNIQAKFSNPAALKITINASNGLVQLNPNLDSYVKGSSVILVANPDDGYEFAEWQGDVTGSNNPVGFVINSDMDITAVFTKITGISDLIDNEHRQTSLLQNYPNPFSNNTTIPYRLARPTKVKLKIYNVLGETITTLVDQYQQAGDYSVEWDTGNHAIKSSSAIYFYSLETEGNVLVKKMIMKNLNE